MLVLVKRRVYRTAKALRILAWNCLKTALLLAGLLPSSESSARAQVGMWEKSLDAQGRAYSAAPSVLHAGSTKSNDPPIELVLNSQAGRSDNSQAAGERPDESHHVGKGTASFEVVSIKPNNSGKMVGFGAFHGYFRAEGVPIEMTIETAYLPLQIRSRVSLQGVAPWVKNQPYDILAKFEDDTAARFEDQDTSLTDRDAILQPLLRNMLADRFGLVVHRVPVQAEGYALTIGKRGAKLTKSQPGDVVPPNFKSLPKGGKVWMGHGKRGSPPKIDFINTSIAQLIEIMSQFRNIIIIDQTGLQGTYNFSLIPFDDPSDGDDSREGQAGFEAAFPWDLSRLGLQLKSIRVSTETVAIDHIDRPSPN